MTINTKNLKEYHAEVGLNTRTGWLKGVAWNYSYLHAVAASDCTQLEASVGPVEGEINGST